MKILSILLRLIAVGCAGYCAYTWMDTQGKTTESMEHMKEVQGDTLQLKTAKVPSILAEKRQTEADLKSTKKTLAETESDLASVEKDLAGAMDDINDLTNQKTENRAEIASLKGEIEELEASVDKGESEVERLENEIVKIKAETEPLIADLQSQIVNLEDSLSNKESEIAEAVAAAEAVLIEQLEAQKAAAPATTIKVDPTTGEEIEVAVEAEIEGEIVTVLKVNDNNTLFVVDKIPAVVEGAPADEISAELPVEDAAVAIEYKVGDRIQFKQKGKFIGEFSVLLIDNNLIACGVINKDLGIPETILIGDSYEMIIAPEVVEVVEAVVIPEAVVAPAVEASYDYSDDSDFGDADSDFGDADSDFGDSSDTDFGDSDFGDTDFGDTDFGDSSDSDFGDTDFGDTDFGDSDDIEF